MHTHMHVFNYLIIYPIQIEEESFLVRVYDSDTEEPSSMERLYVCLSDRFLEERNFGSGKVRNNYRYSIIIVIDTLYLGD